MIAAPLRLFERDRAEFVRGIEPPESHPDLGEVERSKVLDDGVASIHSDSASTLEVPARFVEVSDLSVEDSQVVEDPRHGLRITRNFERAEAVGVERGGLAEIAAHARQHTTILLDHSEKSRVPGSLGELCRLGVEPLGLLLIAAALCDRAQTVESVCHCRIGADECRLLQALRVTSESGLGFAFLSQ